MSVDTKHSEYIGNFSRWQRYRHVLEGEDAVKDAGVLYLPKLQDMTEDDYIAHKDRALFFNASGRTVDSFVGMIFRKDPDIEAPDAMGEFQEDVTLQGQNFYDYLKFLVREVIGIGRSGSLVEWSEEEGRAYVANYPAEQIINWRTGRVNGKTCVTMIVLKERVTEGEAFKVQGGGETADQTKNVPARSPLTPGVTNHYEYTGGASQTIQISPDEYNPKLIDQIRVLKLIPPASEKGEWVYTVEIWQEVEQSIAAKSKGKKSGTKKKFELVATMTPVRRGKTIPEIPFVFHNPNNLLPNVDKSPMQDIISVNLSHYRTSADLEHGRHYTGLPTPYVMGEGQAKQQIKIGSSTAITGDDANTKVGYLEFTGTGLKALESAMDQKEHQMAVLGARMLEAPKRAAETVEVLQMKQTGEQASLAQIAATVSSSAELILRWALWWSEPATSLFADTEKDITVELNTEFNPTDINPQLALAIQSLYLAKLLSRDSAVAALKRGELVAPTRTVDEEIALIETEMSLTGDRIKLKKDPSGSPEIGE